jgi:1-acyl-sn-glycerol-3-phosphate acyltransferase
MNLRAIRRAVALGLALLRVIFRFWRLRLRGPLTLESRALWMQSSCRLVLDGLGVHYRVEGAPPTSGLVVANHLGYLDILILSAAMPCFFVSKMEIAGWPFFGAAARAGGTIFLDRSSLASANSVAEEIIQRLKGPVPVLLFPEGTTSDGSQVLPFRSRLIDPATTAGAPITAAAILYMIDGGIEERELCWIGDAAFLPHLWKTLGTPGFFAVVRFGQPRLYPDRRAAADATYAEISAMRAELP